MSNRIEQYDLIAKQALGTVDDAKAKLMSTLEVMKLLAKEGVEFNQKFKVPEGLEGTVKATKKVNTSTNKLLTTEKELKKQKETLIKTEAKRIASMSKANKETIKSRIETSKNNTEIKKQIQLQETQKGSINRIEKELADNIRKYKELTAAQRANDKVGGSLLRTIQKQDKSVKSLNEQLGRSQRNVGNYGTALKNVGSQMVGALGVVGGVTAFVSVLRNATKVVMDFSKAQSELGALSGKTKEELEGLTDQSLLLGSTTEYTATQATKAQTALVKLGLSVGEIENSTPEILKFASATGAELPAAAKTAAVAMRAFGLDASKMGDITSALAVSTTKSALSFEDFDTILSTIGPVAKAYGFTLEDTIDLTGQLKNAGFDASSAATATRNIMLNLADSNGKLAQSLGRPVKNLDDLAGGLQELDAKGIDLAETLELTDKRSVAAFNTFLEGSDTLGSLRDSVTGANDELDEMVEKRLDNLAGDMTKLTSAWQGFILSIEKGDGVLSKVSRGAIQFLTDALGGLSSSADDAREKSNELSLVEFGKRDVKEFQAYVDKMESYGIKMDDMTQASDKFLKIDQERLDTLKASEEPDEKQIKILENRIKSVKQYVQVQKDAAKAEEEAKAKREAAELAKAQKEYEQFVAGVQKAQEKVKVSDPLTVDDFIEMPEEDFKFEEPDLTEASNAYNRFWSEQKLKIRENAGLFSSSGEEREKAEAELAEKMLQLRKTQLESELENGYLSANEEIDAKNEVMDIEQQLHDQKMANLDAEAEKRREVTQQSIELVGQGFDAISGLYDSQMARVDQKHEYEVATTEEGSEARIRAEQKYDNEKRKIERKQAMLTRAQGLFDVGVNTAIAITKALSQFGPIAGPIFAVVMGAIGAAQAAAILSQPLPAFKKGGTVLEDTLARVSEEGSELAISPGGQAFLTPESESVIPLQKGTEIIPHEQTQRILARQAYSNANIEMGKTNKILEQIRDNKGDTYENGYKYTNRRGVRGKYLV